MPRKTGTGWANATFNPGVGCTPISSGSEQCNMNQKRQDNLRQRIRRMQARDVISEADIFLRCGGADLWVDHLIELPPDGNDCIRERSAYYWRTMEGECIESGVFLVGEDDTTDTRIGIGGNLHADYKITSPSSDEALQTTLEEARRLGYRYAIVHSGDDQTEWPTQMLAGGAA